mmetsp:Transcript_29981/g.86032  ORF Transcript_29981/g.86032 Transcript_29981/m.86032 type:complete len:225 (-) Transcript_29981:201-875(-)
MLMASKAAMMLLDLLAMSAEQMAAPALSWPVARNFASVSPRGMVLTRSCSRATSLSMSSSGRWMYLEPSETSVKSLPMTKTAENAFCSCRMTAARTSAVWPKPAEARPDMPMQTSTRPSRFLGSQRRASRRTSKISSTPPSTVLGSVPGRRSRYQSNSGTPLTRTCQSKRSSSRASRCARGAPIATEWKTSRYHLLTGSQSRKAWCSTLGSRSKPLNLMGKRKW